MIIQSSPITVQMGKLRPEQGLVDHTVDEQQRVRILIRLRLPPPASPPHMVIALSFPRSVALVGSPVASTQLYTPCCPRWSRWTQTLSSHRCIWLLCTGNLPCSTLENPHSSSRDSSYLPATLTALETSLPSWTWPQHPCWLCRAPTAESGHRGNPAHPHLGAWLTCASLTN